MDWGMQALWWMAWIIPAILVFLVAAFALLAPALMLGGAVIKGYEVVRGQLDKKARAETHLSAELPLALEREPVYDHRTTKASKERATEKEMVETKS